MTRFTISLPVVVLTVLAFLGTQTMSQAQFYNDYGYNDYGYNNYTPLYGGNYGSNFGGYGTAYNQYLANRAVLTPNVYNNALPYTGNFGFGYQRYGFSQYQYNVSPFGGFSSGYRYGQFFRR